jgi:hypothetical protein
MGNAAATTSLPAIEGRLGAWPNELDGPCIRRMAPPPVATTMLPDAEQADGSVA